MSHGRLASASHAQAPESEKERERGRGDKKRESSSDRYQKSKFRKVEWSGFLVEVLEPYTLCSVCIRRLTLHQENRHLCGPKVVPGRQ